MSAGGARRGRRDNGLEASDYAVAGDVDPRIGEHLLDVLAASGIAAYLQPSADLNPVLRATTFPARPTDRLFVDRTHLSVAKEHLSQLADEPTASAAESATPAAAATAADATARQRGGDTADIDAQWAQIIAKYDATIDPAARTWPAAEDAPPDRPTDRHEPPSRGGGLQSAVDFSGISLGRHRTDEPSLLDGLDTFGTDLTDSDTERYTPPPPPPLPHISKYAVFGVLGVVAGFVLFIFPGLLPIDPNVTTVLGFASVVAGAVTLIWRLRSGDDDDDVDDGAVV